MIQTLVYPRGKKMYRLEDNSDIKALLETPGILLWVDVSSPTEEDIDVMVDVFAFHQLAIEDAIIPQNQPKLDDYEDYLFVVIHEMTYPPKHQDALVSANELNVFVGKNYVMTIHSAPLASVSRLFQRCLAKPQVFQHSSGFLLHAILDQVVDGYFPIVEQLEERIEKLEDEVLEAADRRVLQHIVELKKTVLMFRNFILPQRKIIGQLGRPSTPIYIRRSTMAYFRDVYDHVVRISDTLDTYRDALNSTMDAYMSTVSQRMNEIMKTLTIITTMMMPLTVITSFYGMNIHLPEVKWGIKGYWFVLGLLALAMGSMWFFIKRRKWI